MTTLVGMIIDSRSQITRKPGIRLTRTGEEGVLVDESSGKVHVVNATAVRVWELCETEKSFTGLRRIMASEYAVPEAELDADLESLLAAFSELDLIELETLP